MSRLRIVSRQRCVQLAASSALFAAFASNASASPATSLDKEWAHSEMRALASEIDALKQIPGNEATIADLRARIEALSARLGGDLPAPLVSSPQANGGFLVVAPDPPGSTGTTTNFQNNTPTPIADNVSNISTITVSGIGTTVWDLDLSTFITHTFGSDLDIRLTSPAGTVVVVSTDNGGSFDNVYNGTVWDDQEATPVSDWLYVNLVTAGPLTPEGCFVRFNGEDPNGMWTLNCADDAGGDIGSFTWGMDITTLDVAPGSNSSSFAQTTPTPIADNVSNISTLDVSGVDDFLCDLDMSTFITHTFGSDLDIRLTSPAGTVVVVSTDNGGSFDNVYNGTVWDDQQATPVTDWLYVNLVTAGPLTPEGAFARFVGEDPNGTWTLNCADDAGGDIGSFTWQLDLDTCPPPPPPTPTPYCFGDGSGTPCPCGNNDGPGAGCMNSTGIGATLGAAGTASISADTFELIANGIPGNQFGLFFQGDMQNNGGLGDPFGDGLRCCGGNVVRWLTVMASNAGCASSNQPSGCGQQAGGIGGPISVLGGNVAGDVRCYQVWYRDNGGPCASRFNLSNGMDVFWLP